MSNGEVRLSRCEMDNHSSFYLIIMYHIHRCILKYGYFMKYLSRSPTLSLSFPLLIVSILHSLTVSSFSGNLAYKVTDQSLRHTLETALSEGTGTVADVRIAEEQGTTHDHQLITNNELIQSPQREFLLLQGLI